MARPVRLVLVGWVVVALEEASWAVTAALEEVSWVATVASEEGSWVVFSRDGVAMAVGVYGVAP